MRKAGKAGGELELIEMIRRGGLSAKGKVPGGVVLGIGDDCAILKPSKNNEILVTTDFSLEGRHFRRDLHSAESVGHRCLARGLSDIAAMGGTPKAAFLSLALPADMPGSARGQKWLKGFLRGFRALGNRYGVPLAGGDTSESPSEGIVADITLVGMVEVGTALRRSTGKAGDALYCTGKLGGAAAELEAMLAGEFKAKVTGGDHPQLFPEPRLNIGSLLRRRGWARACIDLSDGLSTDLAHLCAASGVGTEIEEALLPMHRLTSKLGDGRALELALNGGEDYELLFSAPAETKIPSKISDVEITRIGRLVGGIKKKGRVELILRNGGRVELAARGWEHFANK